MPTRGQANLSSLRRSGRAGDVAAGRAEVAGPRLGHVCAKVCGGGRAGAGWGAGEVSLTRYTHSNIAVAVQILFFKHRPLKY